MHLLHVNTRFNPIRYGILIVSESMRGGKEIEVEETGVEERILPAAKRRITWGGLLSFSAIRFLSCPIYIFE